MKLLRKIYGHVQADIAEYYTLFVIVFAIPMAIGMMLGFKCGLLLSFVLQAIVGTLYIRGRGGGK